MPDSSDAVMPGRSKLAGMYISRQSSFSRNPGIEFRRMAKAAPTPFATMSSREKRCLPVNPSTASPHDAEGDERPCDRGACGTGRIGSDPVRQDVGNDVGREGVVGVLSHGPIRFNALQRAIPGISHRMLSTTTV